jgi:uncharacterized protein YqeY
MASEAQLQTELQTAMKARASDKVMVLRDIITAIKNLKVEKMAPELAEADIVGLIRKEVSKRAEAIEFARKAGRDDLIAKNEAEKNLLEAYLPQLMTADALDALIRSIAQDLGTTQIGPVMAKLREGHAGKFDGKLASELIRKLAT